ncbi:opacity family porin [Nitrospira moscoviensis]|uniref:Porin opacity type domain-containing protein n=1 Tax=Nitrospira moscoviensis TaxID=42253 RepID=A0A0K2GDU6_NITMO|nr:outer membrane beta-barrel protein [Nitrospira moscoviensis]ALA59126.1 exported protein of unknown function [Nitrospira moscoviensis]
MTFHTSFTLSCFGAAALITVGTMLCPSVSEAQRSTEREGDQVIITPSPSRDPERDPIVISPTESGAAGSGPAAEPGEAGGRARMTAEERERMAAELQEAFPREDPRMGGGTPRTDRLIAQARAEERERMREEMREVRNREGEVYIGGFGGATLGNVSTSANMERSGALAGQGYPDQNLQNSAVYGLKIGYFHPGRLNWLGLEIEGYNSNPHLIQSGLTPGSHLRLTVLGLNAIARTKLGCGDRKRDRDDPDYSPLHENSVCPLQPYIGAGLGVFFAETNNQFGRSTENARAGLNALAGVKYFFNDHIALFAEYKFNYVNLKFDQFSGPTAGLNGTMLISHVVGGLAVHF